jgi:hypothetical protein
MSKTVLTLLLVLLTSCISGQNSSTTSKFNLDLERSSASGALPDGWFIWGNDFSLTVDTVVKHSGRQSVRIEPSGTYKTGTFGCLATSFPAVYKGNQIELRAWMKLEDVSEGPAGLFTMGPALSVPSNKNGNYKGKIVILVNEITLSQAEYTTMAFRTAPGAVVVGTQTAGADGNISPFSLPGGISTLITGIGVYYPDGGETQRVGIVPDIEVRPTVAGVREGRDEVLEKAIGIITGENTLD